MSPGEGSVKNTRSSPRAIASLEVDVEVEGERRKVILVSRDIGAGGLFLRTTQPAPIFKKVKLEIRLPEGGSFSVGGEVVRCVSPEAAKQNKHPPGMAVAFDEVSRTKRKELIALVLDLCSQRPSKAEREQAAAQADSPADDPAAIEVASPEEEPAQADDSTLDAEDPGLDLEIQDPVDPEPETSDTSVVVSPGANPSEPVIGSEDDPDEHFGSRTDTLLGELDSLLDEVEVEDSQPAVQASPPPAPEPEPEPEPPAADDATVKRLRAVIAKYKQTLAGDTHYDVLRLGRKASHKQIENAYKKLMGFFKPPGPPDSLPEDVLRDLSSILGKIRKAFAILGKPDRKRAYDFLIDNGDEDP